MSRFLELAQDDFERRNLALVRLADDDRRVADRRDIAHLVHEFHRAGAIDEGHGLAEERRARHVGLDAHAVGAGLGAGIAHAVAVRHAAGAADGSGAFQDRFEEGGLAALKRADDGDASRAPGLSAVGAMKVSFPAPKRRALVAALAPMLCLSCRVGKCSAQTKTAGLCARPFKLLEARSRQMGRRASSRLPTPSAKFRPVCPLTERVEAQSAVIAADQHVGAKPSADGRLCARPHIGAGKRARRKLPAEKTAHLMHARGSRRYRGRTSRITPRVALVAAAARIEDAGRRFLRPRMSPMPPATLQVSTPARVRLWALASVDAEGDYGGQNGD